MIEYTATEEKGQIKYVWFVNKESKQPNDVHVGIECESVVLGHNTQDIVKCEGTPLAVFFEKDSTRLQYKNSETSVDNVPVDPEVFHRHFKAFLIAVRDETLAKPYVAPKKPVELEE